ncbi:hypothetical protein EVAR_100351_1 [Eumeta japonica]|uniref:Uncharacterized protein n=1 Tax=Eumeta variegata TaxID=151549 RepID=A0A4C2AG88_EUMVA|nr:hypothetical protein EVAR_100351_1 [Eumeta japonica]
MHRNREPFAPRGQPSRTRGRGGFQGVGPPSGEDENWETTSEHSEGGGHGSQRRTGGASVGTISITETKIPLVRQNNSRNNQNVKKESSGATELTDGMSELKIKKDDDIPDDGFQSARNKNSKRFKGPTSKDEAHQSKQQRSHSNQGGARNGSTSRNGNDKALNSGRGSVPVSSKSNSQYDRPRQPNLAPRFVKQRQKQQLGLVSGFGSDTGAVPPPPPVNAWDKPISQTLRANIEENNEILDTKSGNSSQRSSPGDSQTEKSQVGCSLAIDKSGVLDGSTPPVETIIFENTNYKTAPPPAEALKQKYQPSANTVKTQREETPNEMDARSLSFNGDVRTPPKSIQELISENGRTGNDGRITWFANIFDSAQKERIHLI